MSEKVKDALWWVGMIVYSIFMLIFTLKGNVPGWFTSGSVTAIAIFKIIISKPWIPPSSPPSSNS